MIEKIDHADIVPKEVIVAKLNKLIEGYNELHEKLDSLEVVINNKTGEVVWRIRSDLLLNRIEKR